MGPFFALPTPGLAVRLTPPHFVEATRSLDAGNSVVWIIDIDRLVSVGADIRPSETGPAPFGGQWLDPVERSRAGKFASERDRSRFTASHAVTRAILGGLNGVAPQDVVIARRPCPRCGEPHGKPHLGSLASEGVNGAGLHFSTSRSDRLLAIAARRGSDIGVDIEVRPAGETLAGLRDLLEAPGDDAGDLLERWVRKEAFLKATGDGLVRPMSSLCLRRHRTGLWRSSPDEYLDIRDLPGISSVTGDRIAAAIAGARPLGPLHVYAVDGD